MAMDNRSVTSSQRPLCSICIANYNGREVIGDAIRSIYDQDCEFPLEIIVHDDASTDGSVEFIRRNFPEIQLIISYDSVGFCVSNNRMVSRAKGDYILLLNNDAILFKDALRVLYEKAANDTKPTILGLPQYDAITNVQIDCGSLLDPFLNTIPNHNPNRTEVGMVIGACLWVPKKLWEELGGFIEWFHSLGEDIYLCCLAQLRGYKVRVLWTSGFLHRVGTSLGGGKIVRKRLSTNKRRRALSERNRSYVMVLVYPSPLFEIILPLHILFLLAEGMALSMIEKDMNFWNEIYWPCIRSLWLRRHKLLKLRKTIQSHRQVSCLKFLSTFMLAHHKLRMVLNYGLPEVR